MKYMGSLMPIIIEIFHQATVTKKMVGSMEKYIEDISTYKLLSIK